jgi:hypothetical protein
VCQTGQSAAAGEPVLDPVDGTGLMIAEPRRWMIFPSLCRHETKVRFSAADPSDRIGAEGKSKA